MLWCRVSEGCQRRFAIQTYLLFVDDEPDMIALVRIIFEGVGWKVLGANDVDEAKAVLGRGGVNAVLADLHLKGANGIELLTWVRQSLGSELPFFFLTGCHDEATCEDAAASASGFYQKPCDWNRLLKEVAATVAGAAAIPGIQAGSGMQLIY
jgi:DNA-binding NtrC family response regulator